MSKNHSISSVLTIMVLIAVTITMVSVITFSNHIVLAQNQKFNTKLSGQQEVPLSNLLHLEWHGLKQCKIRYGLNLM